MPEALRLALTTFTVLPLRPARVDRRTAGGAVLFGPLVGICLALLVDVALFLGRTHFHNAGGSLLSCAMAIALLAILTRGLHLDGLVDTVDALASAAPRERALTVMAAPEAGPLGVAALVLVLVLQFLALFVCVQAHTGTVALTLSVAAGRLAVVWACTTGVPAARTTGLGSMVAGTVRPALAGLLTLAIAAAAGGFGVLDPDGGGLREGAQALVALAVGLTSAAVLLRHAVRRFGGITGDVLGALVETTTVLVLLVMAVRVTG